MISRLAPLVLILSCVGCSDDDAVAPMDGGGFGEDATVDDGVAPPAPPMIDWVDPTSGEATSPAAPPVLTPCPDGWREVADHCDPWPETGPAICPIGQAHFPGEPGCVDVGAVCPIGTWPDDALDDGTNVFVLAGATAGDGSRAQPFGTIAEAMGVATPTQTVLVGEGTYPERVVLTRGVILRGVCTARVSLASPDPPSTIDARGGTVRDLSIRGGTVAGIIVGPGVGLVVEGVVVHDVSTLGIAVSGAGANVTLRSVAVSAPRPDAGPNFGWCLTVQDGAHVTADRLALTDCTEVAANASSHGLFEARRMSVRGVRGTNSLGAGVRAHDAEMDLHEVALDDNQPSNALALVAGRIVLENARVADAHLSAGGQFGRGLVVVNDAAATVTRTWFVRNHTAHLLVDGGSEVSLHDVLLEDGQPDSSGSYGRGAEVVGDSALDAERVAVRDCSGDGVILAPGQGTFADVTVERLTIPPMDAGGAAFAAGRGASLLLERAVVADAECAGVLASGADLGLSDVWIRGTRNTRPGLSADGMAMQIDGAAALTARRLVFEESEMLGVVVVEEGTVATLVDGVVRRTAPQPVTGLFGRGIDVSAGATLELERVVIAENHEHGIAQSNATLRLTDVQVTDTRPVDSDGSYGRGLSMQRGGVLSATRLRVERSSEFGVLLLGDIDADVTDLFVEDVQELACTSAACADTPLGLGVAAWGGSAAHIERFVISDAALCGVMVGSGGEVDLADGEVRGCAIGACVPASGFDVARLQTRVRYVDNDTNLQTSELPVPDAAATFGD